MPVTTYNLLFASGLKKSFKIGRNKLDVLKDVEINIKNAKFKTDHSPIENGCFCYTCKNFSRGYLSHLYKAAEMTYFRLASIHNLHYYLNLMRECRQAIIDQRWDKYKIAFYAKRDTK